MVHSDALTNSFLPFPLIETRTAMAGRSVAVRSRRSTFAQDLPRSLTCGYRLALRQQYLKQEVIPHSVYDGRREICWRRMQTSTLPSTTSTSKKLIIEESRENEGEFWRKDENVRASLDLKSAALGILTLDDWYKVSASDLSKLGLGELLKIRGPLWKILQAIYPLGDWHPWLFRDSVGAGYWKEINNQKHYLEWLARSMGKRPDDPEFWYTASADLITEHHGSTLLRLYDGSIYRLVSANYPNLDLLAWKFHSVPKGYWLEKENRRVYLDWLASVLGFSARSDWYKVKTSDFAANFGNTLIGKYKASVFALVSSTYDDFTFLPWLFLKVPAGFFNIERNRKAYIDWLIAEVGVKHHGELRTRHFREHNGLGLLAKYRFSTKALLESIDVSAADVQETATRSLFESKSRNYWVAIDNQRAFMEALGAKLGVKEPSQWYGVTTRMIEENGGRGLLEHYKKSPILILSALYPQHEWLPWRFATPPRYAYRSEAAKRTLAKYIASALNLSSGADWARVRVAQLHALGVASATQSAGGVSALAKFH